MLSIKTRNSQFNNFLCGAKILSILFFSILLTACAPEFKLESSYNRFRGTNVCKMQNNIVKNHNLTKYSTNVSFNLEEDTEYKIPYTLAIKVITSSTIPPYFRNDSFAHIKLVRNGQTDILKLQAFLADQDSSKNVSSTPGYVTSAGTYVSGSVYTTTTFLSNVYFHITKEQMLKIASADEVNFEVEASEGKPLMAILGPKNIENLRAFRNNCK